ncbi:MAG: chemotaxis protein CheC [Arcobacter sp.]|nr:MAG: chemotaxis protein CheC [Arcobacter sp.]
MNELILNEDEQDCLQELMNIAYGSATASITEILNAHAELGIPRIKIINANELYNYLEEESQDNTPYFVSVQQFNGEITGENLFIIDKISAKNIALQFGLEEDEIDDNELFDIILEITNILSSATISKFSQELDAPVSFSPPSVDLLESIINLDNRFAKDYEKIIIVSTDINFKEQNINGQFLILTTDESIITIKKLLNKILDEL